MAAELRANPEELCVAAMTASAGGGFRLGRVLRTNDHGVITHVSLNGDLEEPTGANNLKALKINKVYSVAGPAGELANRRAVFPTRWETLAEARKQVYQEWAK